MVLRGPRLDLSYQVFTCICLVAPPLCPWLCVCVCVCALAHAAHNKASIYTGFMAAALSGRGGRVLSCHLDIVCKFVVGKCKVYTRVCTHTFNTAARNTIPSTQRVGGQQLSVSVKQKKVSKEQREVQQSFFFFFFQTKLLCPFSHLVQTNDTWLTHH